MTSPTYVKYAYAGDGAGVFVPPDAQEILAVVLVGCTGSS